MNELNYKDEKSPQTVRTDLAIEAKEMITEKDKIKKDKIPGIKSKNYRMKNIQVSELHVSAKGAETIDKKEGTYITIFADGVKKQDTKKQGNAVEVLAKKIQLLLEKNKISPDHKGLVVGLGNWNVTPDALGPMAVEKVLVTNHLYELQYEEVEGHYRPLAAISPGVMGTTGMETSDIVLSIIERFKPDFVLVIDALASRSIERINETIQITDTGIHPGSGVGNKRKEISKDTLGVPVIAIGVPTVVDAVTIASDTLNYLLQHIGREWTEKDSAYNSLIPKELPIKHENLSESDLPDEERRTAFLGLVGNLSADEKRKLIAEVLTPMDKNLIVTPKEVDGFMKDMAHVIAGGINAALHKGISPQDSSEYTRSF